MTQFRYNKNVICSNVYEWNQLDLPTLYLFSNSNTNSNMASFTIQHSHSQCWQSMTTIQQKWQLLTWIWTDAVSSRITWQTKSKQYISPQFNLAQPWEHWLHQNDWYSALNSVERDSSLGGMYNTYNFLNFHNIDSIHQTRCLYSSKTHHYCVCVLY